MGSSALSQRVSPGTLSRRVGPGTPMAHAGRRPALRPRLLRELEVDATVHPRGQPHLSAASGLVCAFGRVYVVADDELHLGVFHDHHSPGALHRIAAGRLPLGQSARKKRKPDLETLLLLPPGRAGWHGGAALLALGSGSTPRRDRAMVVPLDGAGEPLAGQVRALDLAPLYAPLRAALGGINIEGALWHRDQFVLLQRGGDGERGTNATLHFELAETLAWLTGAAHVAPRLREVRPCDLGRVRGVAYGYTDAAALPAHCGGGFLFTAVAEASGDNVADGACVGSALGRIDARGRVAWMRPLHGAPKVEGLDLRPDPVSVSTGALGVHRLQICLVTDADDPACPSQLLQLVDLVA